MGEPLERVYTAYANSETSRQDWLKYHPDGECIVSDAFPQISWIENTIATQQSLIHKGRHDLLRPLYKEPTSHEESKTEAEDDAETNAGNADGSSSDAV